MIRLEASYIISETVHFLEILSGVRKIYVEDLWYLNIFIEKALDHPEIYGDCRSVFESIQNDLGGTVKLVNYYNAVEFSPLKYLDNLKKYKTE